MGQVLFDLLVTHPVPGLLPEWPATPCFAPVSTPRCDGEVCTGAAPDACISAGWDQRGTTKRSVACPIFVDTPFSSCFHQRLSVADFNLWMLGGLTPLLNRVNDMGGLSLGPCFPALGLGPQSEDSELSSFLRSSQAFFSGVGDPCKPVFTYLAVVLRLSY